jgi:hypothetical protein
MLIGLLGLIAVLLLLNMVFYEYRVIKHINSKPKYITKSWVQLELRRKYKK